MKTMNHTLRYSLAVVALAAFCPVRASAQTPPRFYWKSLAGANAVPVIYQDISGAQKRSVWNLSNHLASDYGLDLSSLSEHGAGESGANHYSRKTLPDFSAHEHINPKSLGEGEPMVEFLRARQQYPQLVAQAEQRLAALRASGGDPAQLARYEALVNKETSTLGSLNVDGTAAEAQALKAEQQAGKGGQ